MKDEKEKTKQFSQSKRIYQLAECLKDYYHGNQTKYCCDLKRLDVFI
jgi:hypothetical protein